jgi:hypothetical protein
MSSQQCIPANNTITSKGVDNDAQRYAYDYVSEDQNKGKFSKYQNKSWKWKTTLEEEASDDDYNGEDGRETETDFLKCQRSHDVLEPSSMQQVRVIFKKELFQSDQSAELFLYTLAQNLPDRALSYEIMHLRGGFNNTFELNYLSYENEFTKELLAMLFVYRQHVDVPYNIELWEISHQLSGFTHKDKRNKED